MNFYQSTDAKLTAVQPISTLAVPKQADFSVYVHLTASGDALLFGESVFGGYVSGQKLQLQLFAWHVPSCFGTLLPVEQVEIPYEADALGGSQKQDVIVLPSEEVLAYFADVPAVHHIAWHWETEAAHALLAVAPALMSAAANRAFVPDLEAYRQGKLRWRWDDKALDTQARTLLQKQLPSAIVQAIAAAFSDRISSQYYGTEEDFALLRQEYPLLLSGEPARYDGWDEASWLIAIGWRQDPAPFRAALQLLEPQVEPRKEKGKRAKRKTTDTAIDADTATAAKAATAAEGEAEGGSPAFAEAIAGGWTLRLVLQDKQEIARLFPVTLGTNGKWQGSWPTAWDAHVQQRGASWLAQLQLLLPPPPLSGRKGRPLKKLSPTRPDPASAPEAGALPDAGAVLNATPVPVAGAASVAADNAAVWGVPWWSQPLDNAAAWHFLGTLSPALLEAGFRLLLPAWWEDARRRKPRVRARLQEAAEAARPAQRSGLGLDSLLAFDWRIAIGELDLSEEEFAQLAAQSEQLIQFRGQWVALDQALLRQIRKALAAHDPRRGISFREVLQRYLAYSTGQSLAGQADASSPNGEKQREAARTDEGVAEPGEADVELLYEVELNKQLEHWLAQLVQPGALPLQPVPEELQAELRSYQKEGFSWLAFLFRFGLGACLADDMGLGKTVQFIAYALHVLQQVREEHAVDHAAPAAPLLIICPTSVLGNWQRELERFAPSLRTTLHYNARRLKGADFLAACEEADIVITSYATAALDQELLEQVEWTCICLDEAQHIKNAQTRQSTAVRTLRARHRIALTGTPVENRLGELWAIYDFINPGYLGSQRGFEKMYEDAADKEDGRQRLEQLQKLVRPFLLRRKKKDPAIQLDLPDKTETKLYLPLTPEQSAMYEHTVQQLMRQLHTLEGMKRRGAILSSLTRLKQLCDHPVLLLDEAVDEAEPAQVQGQVQGQVQVQMQAYTQQAQTPMQAQAAHQNEAFEWAAITARSVKLERLVEMVRELRAEEEQCLIFTQYIGMGQLMQKVLGAALAEPVLYLNGSTPKKTRDRMIEQFQNGEVPIFILSLKAGGVGLNLTAASHVFHVDRWWNPAVENQATDRAYRMGQTRHVQVHKFITIGTLEERIDELLERKQQLSDQVIVSSDSWITELSTEELRELFTLRRDS